LLNNQNRNYIFGMEGENNALLIGGVVLVGVGICFAVGCFSGDGIY